jgi:DNA-binding HxlR family transcriptional regulator
MGGTPIAATDPDSTIAEVARLVGDKWAMLVVRDVFRGVRRFDDLCGDLGVGRAVLADRLKRLVEAGVLTKSPYGERPVRYEYRLTEMGMELSPMLVALLRWGDRWLGGGEPTAVLVHARATPSSSRRSGAAPARPPSARARSSRGRDDGHERVTRAWGSASSLL